MPECSQTPRRQRPDYLADFTSGSSADNSCSSSDEDEEEERRKAGGRRSGEKRGEKKVSYDLGESKEKNLAERSGRGAGCVFNTDSSHSSARPYRGHRSAGLTHTDRQLFALTFTPMGSLASSLNLTPLTEAEYLERSHANMRRTCKRHRKGAAICPCLLPSALASPFLSRLFSLFISSSFSWSRLITSVTLIAKTTLFLRFVNVNSRTPTCLHIFNILCLNLFVTETEM